MITEIAIIIIIIISLSIKKNKTTISRENKQTNSRIEQEA